MTHEELREKVALTISAADQSVPPGWQGWLQVADAAISAVREALREPSEGMVKSANEPLLATEPAWLTDGDAAEVWRAMFAASPLADPRA